MKMGSTCCRTDTGWSCCRKHEACCGSGGSGNTGVEVPGFYPACCHITSMSAKAQCCKATSQKIGVIPACCDNQRVRPVCCTVRNVFTCCVATVGIPPCCLTVIPIQTTRAPPNVTQTELMTLPTPERKYCCHDMNPQEHCCPSMFIPQVNILMTQPPLEALTPRPTTMTLTTKRCCSSYNLKLCCPTIQFLSTCCRKLVLTFVSVPASCCRVSGTDARIACCRRIGPRRSCCLGQPRTPGHPRIGQRPNIPLTSQRTYTAHTVWRPTPQYVQQTTRFLVSCCDTVDRERCCHRWLPWLETYGLPQCCPAGQSSTNRQEYDISQQSKGNLHPIVNENNGDQQNTGNQYEYWRPGRNQNNEIPEHIDEDTTQNQIDESNRDLHWTSNRENLQTNVLNRNEYKYPLENTENLEGDTSVDISTHKHSPNKDDHELDWITEREKLDEILRSEELYTVKPENSNKDETHDETEYVLHRGNHSRYEIGKRQALCSGFQYDTKEFICCDGNLQVKLGPQSACCGRISFDVTKHKCCNGKVQESCPGQSKPYPWFRRG